MPIYLLVLENDRNRNRWLARKSGNNLEQLTSNCTYNSDENQLFNKKPSDQIVACPCRTLVDEMGNSANVIMVKIINN